MNFRVRPSTLRELFRGLRMSSSCVVNDKQATWRNAVNSRPKRTFVKGWSISNQDKIGHNLECSVPRIIED